jgi:hypothetical protein
MKVKKKNAPKQCKHRSSSLGLFNHPQGFGSITWGARHTALPFCDAYTKNLTSRSSAHGAKDTFNIILLKHYKNLSPSKLKSLKYVQL